MRASPSDIGFGPRFVAPVLSGPALNPVNTTMIAVALVPIAQATGVSASQAIWLVAGLYIVSAVAQPAMGRIADIFGPKKVYVTGLLLVMVGELVPAVWASFPGALLSRIIIGLGTSAAYPSAMTLISDQARRLGRPTPRPLLTGLSVSSLVTTAVGPVIGGLLVHQLGWQWIFIVNTPVAAVILLFVLVWLPADNTRESAAGDSGLDIPGMAVFTVMLVSALLFFLDLDAGLNWLIPVAVVALGVLVWWGLRVDSPFIDLRMLVGNGALTRTYLRMIITYTGMYLMVYGFTQWLQDAAGYSADHAGLIQLSTAAFALVCSWIVVRSTSVRGAADRRGHRPDSRRTTHGLRGRRKYADLSAPARRRLRDNPGLRLGVQPEGRVPQCAEGGDGVGVRPVPHGDPDRGDRGVQHHRSGVRGARHRCRRAHAGMDSAGARTGRYAADRDG